MAPFIMLVKLHWNLHPWGYSRPDWTCSWAACSGRHCLEQGAGWGDLQGSHPPSPGLRSYNTGPEQWRNKLSGVILDQCKSVYIKSGWPLSTKNYVNPQVPLQMKFFKKPYFYSLWTPNRSKLVVHIMLCLD